MSEERINIEGKTITMSLHNNVRINNNKRRGWIPLSYDNSVIIIFTSDRQQLLSKK